MIADSNYDWTALQSTNHLPHRIIFNCNARVSGSEAELRPECWMMQHLKFMDGTVASLSVFSEAFLGRGRMRAVARMSCEWMDLIALRFTVFSEAFDAVVPTVMDFTVALLHCILRRATAGARAVYIVNNFGDGGGNNTTNR